MTNINKRIRSIETQIANKQSNLDLVNERISEFVSLVDVPIQLSKERKNLESDLARLTEALERLRLQKSRKERAPERVAEEKKGNSAAGDHTEGKTFPLWGVVAVVVLIVSVIVGIILHSNKSRDKQTARMKFLIDSIGLAAYYFEKKPSSPYAVRDFFDTEKRLHDPALRSTPWTAFVQNFAGTEIPDTPIHKILAFDSTNDKLLLNFNLPPEKSQWNGFSIHVRRDLFDNSNDILGTNMTNWKYYSSSAAGEKEFIYMDSLGDIIQFQLLK